MKVSYSARKEQRSIQLRYHSCHMSPCSANINLYGYTCWLGVFSGYTCRITNRPQCRKTSQNVSHVWYNRSSTQ